ncbi:MAG TPA: hypothetical protein VHH33_03640 [Nitrososphaeraceae archaeon]|jgi:hypothetical protein|nr:hypothetical protein [Nitrososphaeraceae archaeon]
MISLASIAISLTIGLVLLSNFAHGQTVLEGSDILVEDGCISYSKGYTIGDTVIINKYRYVWDYQKGQCSHVAEIMQYFLDKGYRVDGENLNSIQMTKEIIK